MASTQQTLDTDFLNTLSATLLEKADVISSEDTNIEKKIGEAISGIKTSQEKSAQRITSQYDREIKNETRLVAGEINTQLENEKGFAVSMTALREATKTGQKRLDDLEQRKQELILQGESEAASQISNLQLQELQFQQEARQKTFSNLLQLGQFGITQQQENRLANAQNFQERSAIASIGLEYGVPVTENDTIETIVAKAAPFASSKQKLELQKITAEINNLNAKTKEALNGIVDMNNYDDTNISALAAAARRNPDVYSQISKNPKLYAQVVNKQSELEAQDVRDTISVWSGSKASLIDAIASDPTITNKSEALNIIENEFVEAQKTSKSNITGLPGVMNNLGKGTLNLSTSILNFLTGQQGGIKY